jgi:hypothetical protein
MVVYILGLFSLTYLNALRQAQRDSMCKTNLI